MYPVLFIIGTWVVVYFPALQLLKIRSLENSEVFFKTSSITFWAGKKTITGTCDFTALSPKAPPTSIEVS